MLFQDYSIRFPKSFIWRFLAKTFDSFSGDGIQNDKISSPKKILVIRKDEMGDLILSLPLYENIKRAYPKSNLTVLAGNQASPLLHGNPYIDNIIKIDTIRDSKLNFIKQYLRLISNIKKAEFDLAIDSKGSILNIVLMYLARIKRRVSYWNVSGGKILLTDKIKYLKQVSELDAGLNLLNKIGIKTKKIIPKIYLSSQEVNEGNKISAGLPKGYCCVYMTPTLPYKSWSIDSWRSLFARFPKTPFVIVVRKSEKETLKIKFDDLKNVQFICLENIRLLSLVLKKAKAVIAVDGGIMHLSWISNPKTIVLFGQNDLTLWAPPRGKTICHFPESQQGLNRKEFDKQKPNEYMDKISVDEVVKALQGYIK